MNQSSNGRIVKQNFIYLFKARKSCRNWAGRQIPTGMSVRFLQIHGYFWIHHPPTFPTACYLVIRSKHPTPSYAIRVSCVLKKNLTQLRFYSCPFCQQKSYTVKFTGPLTKEELEKEAEVRDSNMYCIWEPNCKHCCAMLCVGRAKSWGTSYEN